MIKTNIVMLVLASRSNKYDKMINNYWSNIINYIKTNKITTIKIFLIFGNNVETSDLNLSEDDKLITNTPESIIPGILDKTISAFTIINNSYNYKHIIRTNLSSFYILHNLINISNGLEDTNLYSGYNGLYKNSIPFISGAGIWLSRDNVQYIIDNQSSLDKQLIDDVAIGKLLINHKKGVLQRYDIINSNIEIQDKVTLLNNIINNNNFHIRIKSNTKNQEIDINYMNKFTEILYIQ